MDSELVGPITRGQTQGKRAASSLRRGRMVVQNCAEDSGKEMSILPKHGWHIWSMEDRSRMESERLDQDTGKCKMQGMLSSGPWT